MNGCGNGMSNQNLPKLQLPESLNYIGVFLTMSCQLKCSYCINIPDSNQELTDRSELFPILNAKHHIGLTPEQWVTALSRIPAREDLPLTIQGGEPTVYYNGKGLNQIIEGIPHYLDILTNIGNMKVFKNISDKSRHKLQRKAPYPSIRVSWHKDEMERTWKDGFKELVRRCEELKDYGFDVSPTKSESDVGIYMVSHPTNVSPDENLWKGKVPFETKEFLGVHDGELYGHYAYKHSTDLISRNIYYKTLECECRTSELLIDPAGFIWGCHHDLYHAWANENMQSQFEFLQACHFAYKDYNNLFVWIKGIKPIGHILDDKFAMDDLKEFRKCYSYGECVGCDCKIKNDRTQSKDDRGVVHTSVEIKNIKWPDDFRKERSIKFAEALSAAMKSMADKEKLRKDLKDYLENKKYK